MEVVREFGWSSQRWNSSAEVSIAHTFRSALGRPQCRRNETESLSCTKVEVREPKIKSFPDSRDHGLETVISRSDSLEREAEIRPFRDLEQRNSLAVTRERCFGKCVFGCVREPFDAQDDFICSALISPVRFVSPRCDNSSKAIHPPE